MATLECRTERPEDWLVANPWLWLPLGLLFSLLAFAWVNIGDEQATAVRMTLLVVGLLCAAGAVTLRTNSARRAYLDAAPPATRSLLLALLFLVFAGLVLGALVMLGLTLLQGGFRGGFGGALLVTVLVVSIAGYVAWVCLNRCRHNKSLDKPTETAALLVLSAVCAYLCSRALYLDVARADRWDTIRLFLAVLAAVTILAAGLVLLPTRAQRILISALILFHFGGILTAVMSAPPTPWVFRQIWARVYRPYLQFLFMNNAYHFYAPEPGPSCFIWFHIEYENNAGEKKYVWDEFPNIREDGLPNYPTSLNYQRRLAMTHHVQHYETTPPPERLLNANGESVQNPIYYWRQVYSDHPPAMTPFAPKAKAPLQVPFHPSIAPALQYRVPNLYAKRMIESFTSHEFKHPPKQFDGYHVVSVKMYKVVHVVAPEVMIAAGIKPTDPVLYHPFYLGKYGMAEYIDAEGNRWDHFELLDQPKYSKDGDLISGDPLLYWLLPILPENNTYDAASLTQQKIYGHVYKHAGDPKWVWHPNQNSPRAE